VLFTWIQGVETNSNGKLGLHITLCLQATVHKRGLGLWPRLNTSPVCDAQRRWGSLQCYTSAEPYSSFYCFCSTRLFSLLLFAYFIICPVVRVSIFGQTVWNAWRVLIMWFALVLPRSSKMWRHCATSLTIAVDRPVKIFSTVNRTLSTASSRCMTRPFQNSPLRRFWLLHFFL